MKKNVFVDMDGVLAKYALDTAERMYDKGFFLNRPPLKGNINFIKLLIKDKRYNVYILSSLLADNEYIVDEKNAWLDKYLPEITMNNRIFVPEGVAKDVFIKTRIKGVSRAENILIDDYTVNLLKWQQAGFKGVKMDNGINNTRGSWITKHPKEIISHLGNPKYKYQHFTKLIA